MKHNHEQKAFTIFGECGRISIIWSATLKGALIRFIKQTGERVESYLPGALIN